MFRSIYRTEREYDLKPQKRIWFSFLSPDSPGVERYLNRLAEQGWALPELTDCRTFSLIMEPTTRNDLRYCIITGKAGRSDGEILETVSRMRELGWEPVATVNQFDIYESMPCREVETPERHGTWVELFRPLGGWLLLAALSVLLVQFARTQGISVLTDWFLSNTGVFLHYFGAFYAAIGLYLLLWSIICCARRNRKASATGWVLFRGLFPALAVLWTILLTAAIMTDLVSHPAYSLLLIGLVVGAAVWLYRAFRMETPEKLIPGLSAVLAIGLLLSLALHQAFPPESRAEMGRCGWRTSLTEVVRGEALGLDDSPVQAVSYERNGSWFVVRTGYWEDREEVRLSSAVYHCNGGYWTGIVLRDLLRTAEWERVKNGYDGCWTVRQGEQYKYLLRQGNRLAVLSCDRDLQPAFEAQPLDLD